MVAKGEGEKAVDMEEVVDSDKKVPQEVGRRIFPWFRKYLQYNLEKCLDNNLRKKKPHMDGFQHKRYCPLLNVTQSAWKIDLPVPQSAICKRRPEVPPFCSATEITNVSYHSSQITINTTL